MPELPEVETTVRALRPVLAGRHIRRLVVRNGRLRWPVDPALARHLAGAHVLAVDRRAKYILVRTGRGCLIVHLGMSGRFCIAAADATPEKHDHVDIVVDNGKILRYTDPRRFGAFLWVPEHPESHPLLGGLGPEPLSRDLTADYLFERSRRRKGPVKSFIMDGQVVVGVGNIYANEALFRAGIRPGRSAARVTREEYAALVRAIRDVLRAAIRAGGTTLRDFAAGERQEGYFRISLRVYGRGGLPCLSCGTPLREQRTAGRSTVWCPRCQV